MRLNLFLFPLPIVLAAGIIVGSEMPGFPATTSPSLLLPERPPASAALTSSFIDYFKQAQGATTSSLLATTATMMVVEGMSTATVATTIPLWLAGPTTGSVLGIPLPLSLEQCVAIGLEFNFGLQNSRRDVLIAASQYRQEQFEFVPFLDIFSGYSYADSKTGIREGSGLEQTRLHDLNVGVQVRQNFPTGGDLTIRQQLDRRRLWEQRRVETVDPLTGRVSVSHPSDRTYDWENSLDITARQPLLRGGGLTVGMASLRLARIAQIQSEITNSIRRRDVANNIIRSYLVILQRQLDARVSLDAIREKKRFYDETIVKHELGEIAESEIWRAKIQWLQEQQRSRQLQQSFLDSLDSLLLLMGLPLETPLRLEEFTGQISDLTALGLTDPEACVREGLARRPEILSADLAIRRAQVDVEVAKNGLLPYLDLEARYTDDEQGPHLRDVRDLDRSRRWSVGALFDWPFPNMANRQAMTRAKLRLEKALTDRQSLERDITEEIRRLHRALLSNEERVKILAETVALAERSLQLENARFYYGENTSTEVRQAQDDLFQARTDYNNAKLRYQSDLASLYRAMGRPLYNEDLELSLIPPQNHAMNE
ncbi:MAG: TolC family protein [Candidatus Sumerlaeia bacterium]|nr:TolC family protein [Candidatus Sumerlaeia bacterium]